MQVALVAQAGSAQADTDTGFVHQLEHVAQALAWLADQIADRAVAFAETQYCRGGVAITHLVQQPGQRHVIAGRDVAILIE
ncbi:hypothetical protein D9M70_479160 [compost metagenome]